MRATKSENAKTTRKICCAGSGDAGREVTTTNGIDRSERVEIAVIGGGGLRSVLSRFRSDFFYSVVGPQEGRVNENALHLSNM